MALTTMQRQRLKRLKGLESLTPRQQTRLDHLRSLRGGGRGGVVQKAADRASGTLDAGIEAGSRITGGVGFDKGLMRMDEGRLQGFLDPAERALTGLRDRTGGAFDELEALRRARLGGLDTAEGQALKESLHRDIDRRRAAGLRDVARTPNLGAGASFAQRRALQRDFGDATDAANRQFMLDNFDIKRQALGDFEGTQQARADTMRGLEGDLANISGARAELGTLADKFNSQQELGELGVRTGAISAGTGLVKDEADDIRENKRFRRLQEFLKRRDDERFAQIQGMF